MQARLLEISNSLSTEELKQMKFLAKSKVSGFQLARIREGYELFEELETRVEHPHAYIGQLLEGIQRLDLSEKLGLPVHDSVKTGKEYTLYCTISLLWALLFCFTIKITTTTIIIIITITITTTTKFKY